MDAALEDVTKNKLEPTAGQKAAEELVRRAQEQGCRWILGARPCRACGSASS